MVDRDRKSGSEPVGPFPLLPQFADPRTPLACATVSTLALILVLSSAALHALWNALVAGARDTHTTTAVALTAGALVFAIPAAVTWDVDGAAWPYIIASAPLGPAVFAL